LILKNNTFFFFFFFLAVSDPMDTHSSVNFNNKYV
jgi:hypothetical protein